MISGLLVKHGWYMVWVITDVRQQKHPTSRFQRDFVDELIWHLLVGRCSATHCGLGRALPYIRPVLCVSSCPPLSAQTHNRSQPAAAAEPSRLCRAPAQNQLECVKLEFEARSSLEKPACKLKASPEVCRPTHDE